MGNIQRGDNRQYLTNGVAEYSTFGDNINAVAGLMNTAATINRQAETAKMAKYQVELSNEFQIKNNEINTKYQADPTSPQREQELKQAFEVMADKYKVGSMVQGEWGQAKQKIYSNFETYNTNWKIQQQKTNATQDLKSGYETMLNQISKMGMNNASLEDVKLTYGNSSAALRTGATPILGSVVVDGFLQSATHDYMACYIDGLMQTDPAKAIQMLNDGSVQADLKDADTIDKLKKQAQSQLLRQNEIKAVDRVADYINTNHELFNKALDGTITTQEAQSILSDKNVDRTMRAVLSQMLGYNSSSSLTVDAETGEIVDKKKEDAMTGDEAAAFQAYSTLTIGNKQWTFTNNKGKLRQPTTQEKEEIRTELLLRGSQLLNGVDGKTPQAQIRKIAEYQTQLAQASYFGLNQTDYNKMMNDFVLPATRDIQAQAKKYNANMSGINPISGKYGWEQIDKYFNEFFDKNLEDTKGNREMIAKEKALASVYYWGSLNSYCSQRGISMDALFGLSREDRAGIYNKAAKDAIEKAKATSSNPQLWFRSANPQYVSAIRSMLPNSNANDVITNIAVASMNNPNMSEKDMQNIINREVRNEYAKMRTSNKSVVFGNNTKYDEIINKYSMLHGVDPLLVKCVIRQESGFNPNARSKVGAMGLMQLMPATARGLGCKNAADPKENIAAGTKHLAGLIAKFNGNTALALAAYNAGEGNVRKYGNKIPPFKETQNYVNSIMKTYSNIK